MLLAIMFHNYLKTYLFHKINMPSKTTPTHPESEDDSGELPTTPSSPDRSDDNFTLEEDEL